MPAGAATCDRLATLSLPNATLTSALVPAGGFTPPGGGAAPAFGSLPAFCRVTAAFHPTSSELGWGGLAGPQPDGEAVEFFRYVVFSDPAWDFRMLDWTTAAEAADRAAAAEINVTDPNLKPFFDRGGKLLLYHGWNDQLVAPLNSVNYYRQIVSTVGRDTADATA